MDEVQAAGVEHVLGAVAEHLGQRGGDVEDPPLRVADQRQVAGPAGEREEELLLLLAAPLDVAQQRQVLEVRRRAGRSARGVAQHGGVHEHRHRPAVGPGQRALVAVRGDLAPQQAGEPRVGGPGVGAVAERVHRPADQLVGRAVHEQAERRVHVGHPALRVADRLRGGGLLEPGAERGAPVDPVPPRRGSWRRGCRCGPARTP